MQDVLDGKSLVREASGDSLINTKNNYFIYRHNLHYLEICEIKTRLLDATFRPKGHLHAYNIMRGCRIRG